ncbi:MAG: ATP-binding protein [Weeksellaceae bacterium]
MKLNYRRRLFLYVGLIFALFTAGVIIFEQILEKDYKTRVLSERLETYTEIIQNGLSKNDEDINAEMAGLQTLLPKDLRITLIDFSGKVLFDNSIRDYSELENHNDRPEIVEAAQSGSGTDIRLSESNQRKYLYFAKNFGVNFIRVALPYDTQLQQSLKPGNAALYFILAVFAVFLCFIHIITRRFGKTIGQLRDFVLSSDPMELKQLRFPDDEVGEIGIKIAENYQKLKESRRNLNLEKQKLLQHIQILEEGICFLSPQYKVEFHNGLFIQYLNTICDEPDSDPALILSDPGFRKLQKFLKKKEKPYFEDQIVKQGKTFLVRANVFEDESLEIILNDITKQEKVKQLKQEMTGNVAHELRTPVAGIRAYLETVLTQDLDEGKKRYFIERSFQQILALSEIIRDMSLIAKMEETPNLIVSEKVNIEALLNRINEEVGAQLKSKNMDFDFQLPPNTEINGSSNLIYSIFRNLTDNAIRYAGSDTKINVSIYNEDADYYYFSFYDTGAGIPDESRLNRIFERFYRVNEGRTRDTGGSGLGLSIVKNAVIFHKGKIAAKNRKNGGLEFLFTLKK